MSMTRESSRSSYKIYVGNLAQATSDNDLFRVFSQFGNVIESVALSNKGYGFVHMANEDDGVRAMKSLYKHQLHGKEMVVQPAINPKKANPTSQYSTRRATIGGKGVSNLDDFSDCYTEQYDHYLEDLSSSSESSPTPNYNSFPYSSVQSSSNENTIGSLSTRTNETGSVGVVSRPTSTTRNNLETNGSVSVAVANGLSNFGSVGSAIPINSSLSNSALQLVGSNNVAVQNLPNFWESTNGLGPQLGAITQTNSGNLSANALLSLNKESALNPILTKQLMKTSANGASFGLPNSTIITNATQNFDQIARLSEQNNIEQRIRHQILLNQQKSQLDQVLNQAQSSPFQQNSTNELYAYLSKCRDIAQSPDFLQSQLLEAHLKNERAENNALKLKQQRIQEQEVQALLLLQQQQHQLQLASVNSNNNSLASHHEPSGNNCSNILTNSKNRSNNTNLSISTDLPLNGSVVTSNSMNNNHMNSFGGALNHHLATNGVFSSISNGVPNMNHVTNTFSNHHLMQQHQQPGAMAIGPIPNAVISTSNNTVTTNSNNNGRHVQQQQSSAVLVLRCGLCNEAYNHMDRVPKILGCTHTFCLRCLHRCALPTGEVRCPGGCGMSTQLTEAGVSGLTTNQGLLSAAQQQQQQQQQQQHQFNGEQSEDTSEVCAVCTGTNQDHGLQACREAGHRLVRTSEAVRVIVQQLSPLVGDTLHMLRDAMKLRASIKERVESTLQSLAKFMDELTLKLKHDNAEEECLITTLNDLTCVHQQLDSQSYSELVSTYHMVDNCARSIRTQYNQCLTAHCVNAAVRSMTLDIHPDALPQLGVSQNESFKMDQSLQDHARVGNYANVLLQYMVADLLSSRLSCAKQPAEGRLPGVNAGATAAAVAAADVTNNFSTITNSDSLDNLSSMQDSRSASSVSPIAGAGDVASVLSITDAAISNGGFNSHTASSSATPDMTAMNRNNLDSVTDSIDHMDINSLIETTAAIEAGNGASDKHDLGHFSDNSTSLGLSNICRLVDDEETEESVDLAKSLLEGSASIEPQATKVQSSAPSPSSSHSMTPPIVSNNTRPSVDCSAASSDSGIVSCKPFSYLDAAKKPAKPQPEPQPKYEVAKLPVQIKQTKSPHCWMKLTVDGKSIGRIVFQLRPDKAPKMCENFLGLCTGKPGFGYEGTHFFKNGDGFLAGGDVEFDDGSGGYSIFNKKKFEADLCPLKDEVGMIRFKGNGTSDAGRGMVGSQFMVWYAEREFKKFSYSLVFGRVVDGIEVVKKAAAVNLSKHDVMIAECGGI